LRAASGEGGGGGEGRRGGSELLPCGRAARSEWRGREGTGAKRFGRLLSGRLVQRGVWFSGERPEPKAKRLPADGEEAARIVARAQRGQAIVESRCAETRRAPPPLLYDLTELQRHANRLYGFSAQTTLDIAQKLYEQHKLISYPRTDSRHLSASVAGTLGAVVAAIREAFLDRLAPGTGQRPLGSRFVDDGKVTDHHAIIPTSLSFPRRCRRAPRWPATSASFTN